MTTVTATKVENKVLRVQVDLGRAPTLSSYADSVDALDKMAGLCIALVTPVRYGRRQEIPDIREIVVVRTSMASPWTTILQDLVSHTGPVAEYGFGGIFCLRQLLNMVMQWQNHRQDVDERDERRLMRLLSEFQAFARDNKPFAEPSAYEVGGEPTRLTANARDAIHRIGLIKEAEILDEDDPRLTERD